MGGGVVGEVKHCGAIHGGLALGAELLQGEEEGLEFLPVRGVMVDHGRPLAHPQMEGFVREAHSPAGPCATPIPPSGNEGAGLGRTELSTAIICWDEEPPVHLSSDWIRDGAGGVTHTPSGVVPLRMDESVGVAEVGVTQPIWRGVCQGLWGPGDNTQSQTGERFSGWAPMEAFGHGGGPFNLVCGDTQDRIPPGVEDEASALLDL